MKRDICITVRVEQTRDWNSLRLFLKGILRHYGIRCIGLSYAEPVSGVVINEVAEPISNVSTDLNTSPCTSEVAQ